MKVNISILKCAHSKPFIGIYWSSQVAIIVLALVAVAAAADSYKSGYGSGYKTVDYSVIDLLKSIKLIIL